MLVVIDYGAGNLRSVMHALNHLGVKAVRLGHHPEDLKDATSIILPGVGAFGAGMQQLQEKRLIEPIQKTVDSGIPYLGICLGMQFLFESSDEMGNHKGLGLLPGHVTRFPEDIKLKIPHMGWNQLQQQKQSPLLNGVDAHSYAYFVHSYYCVPQDDADVLITTEYGLPFTSGVQRDNIYAVQFHPEKSQSVGLKILSNFLTITEETQ